MIPADADRAVRRYLRLADRLLPGRIVCLYLVGSVALGAFRPGESDIDFVAAVEGDLDAAEVRRLRLLHAATALRSASPSIARGNLTAPGVCNGVYVRATDLSRPVSTIVPLASHVGAQVPRGDGSTSTRSSGRPSRSGA